MSGLFERLTSLAARPLWGFYKKLWMLSKRLAVLFY